MLDSTKASKKSAIQGRGMNPDDEVHLSEEARAEIEAAEDEFVNQTEEAVGVMKNVSPAAKPSVPIVADLQHRY
jgi:hypothetical protein